MTARGHLPRSRCRYASARAFLHNQDPNRNSATRSLDHLVSAGEERGRHCEAERLGGPEIDRELEFGRRMNWQVGRLLALEDAIHVTRSATVLVEKIGTIG